MPFDKFLIKGGQGAPPFTTGLQTDMEPWIIADDAFADLQNLYVFRGRVRKRFGTQLTGSMLMSRLRINIGTTDGSGNISVTVPGGSLGIAAIGQMFSIGAELFTVDVTGTPAVMLDTGAATVKTYNTTTGALVIHGAAITTAVFFYPALPVMGITEYQAGNINNHVTYAFDPYFAYKFTNGTGWARSGTGTAPLWNGQLDTNFLNFFQVCNWKGATVNTTTMFVTNFQVTNLNGVGTATDDPIWYTSDGSTWVSIKTAAANSFYFMPVYSGSPQAPYTGAYVLTARIIVAFRNRLVFLNTVENDNANHDSVIANGNNTNYPQRARYSFNGSPLAVNAWYEPNQSDSSGNIAAGAGFIDATTDEIIVSAEFIKDRLIVYFERSTWELAYTGNEQLPFVWNKLNDQLGSQSLFSSIPFDKQVLTVGETGVHACNGSNVDRIDRKIPELVFTLTVQNQNSERIAGIRDFQNEVVYWAIPADNNPNTALNWNNEIVLYNYVNNTWALFDDSFTAFGYLDQSLDLSWQNSAPITWAEANFSWVDNVQTDERTILAGNQEGFVMQILPQPFPRNSASLQVTNIAIDGVNGFLTLTIVNHNLSESATTAIYEGDYIALEDQTSGDTGMTNVYVDTTNILGIYPVVEVTDANTVVVQMQPYQLTGQPFAASGDYLGGATAARVSNTVLESKQWNPYDKEDRNLFLQRINFLVTKTDYGQITADYFPSSTKLPMIGEGQASGSIMGNGILETSPYSATFYPLEAQQERLWHPVYFQTTGECIQLFMYMNDSQMRNPNITWSDLEIHAFLLWVNRSSSRLQ